MTEATAPAGLLTVADVARLRGCDHTTAWRLLTRLEREHGAKLVRQTQPRLVLYISASELREGLARMPPEGVSQLRRELSSVRRRILALESEVREFRRLSHDWFRTRHANPDC
jgi:hypothetical protein